MMGGMKYLADRHKFHNRQALRKTALEYYSQKVLNRISARSFAQFEPRGQPPTNAILRSDTHL